MFWKREDAIKVSLCDLYQKLTNMSQSINHSDEDLALPNVPLCKKGVQDKDDRQRSLVFIHILFFLLKQDCDYLVDTYPSLSNDQKQNDDSTDFPSKYPSHPTTCTVLASTQQSGPTRKQMNACFIHEQARIIVRQGIDRVRQPANDDSTSTPEQQDFMAGIECRLRRIEGIQRYWDRAQTIYLQFLHSHPIDGLKQMVTL